MTYLSKNAAKVQLFCDISKFIALECDFIQIFLVDEVEGVVVGAVDVEDGDDFSLFADGHNNLAFGGGGTGDVSGELMHVGYDERLVLRPGGAADAFAVGDAGTGDGPLERTEDQFGGSPLVPPRGGGSIGDWFDEVEAGPPEMESGVEYCGDVRHIRNKVRLPGNESVDLRDEGLVRCFFMGFEFGEVGEDAIHF